MQECIGPPLMASLVGALKTASLNEMSRLSVVTNDSRSHRASRSHRPSHRSRRPSHRNSRPNGSHRSSPNYTDYTSFSPP